MYTKNKNIILSVEFQCKCQQIKDSRQFIRSSSHSGELKLLCPICERKYRISLKYEEIM